MIYGRLLFKCRMCGKKHEVSSEDIDTDIGKREIKAVVRMHYCGGNRFGIADLIGGWEDGLKDTAAKK